MANYALKDFFEKIPVIPLLVAYLAWVGYDYYQFTVDPTSPLLLKRAEIENIDGDINALRTKIKQVNEFSQSLKLKKAQLRQLAQDLESSKATLSENLDLPELMKLVLIEAKRAGLSVVALRPGEGKSVDFYAQQEFEFNSSGFFFQYVAFLDRVSNLQKIIRVDSFHLVPANNVGDAKYVTLNASVRLKAFRYLGSKADEVLNGAAYSGDGRVPSKKGS